MSKNMNDETSVTESELANPHPISHLSLDILIGIGSMSFIAFIVYCVYRLFCLSFIIYEITIL